MALFANAAIIIAVVTAPEYWYDMFVKTLTYLQINVDQKIAFITVMVVLGFLVAKSITSSISNLVIK